MTIQEWAESHAQSVRLFAEREGISTSAALPRVRVLVENDGRRHFPEEADPVRFVEEALARAEADAP